MNYRKNYLKNCIFTMALLWSAIATVPLSAQMKHDYYWITGYDTNIDTTSLGGGVILDFNTSPLTIKDPKIYHLNLWQSNASISNKLGQLVAYTNGCSVFNNDHKVMINGDSLNQGFIEKEYCYSQLQNYPARNGCVFLPHPDDDQLYYLVHERVHLDWSNPSDWSTYGDQFLYSLISFKNNTNGQVIIKNKLIFSDTLGKGMIKPIKHNNGRDWWFIQFQEGRNSYYKILFQFDSTQVYPKQMIGAPIDTATAKIKYAACSPDGSKYCIYNSADQVYLYDFDNLTGDLSNWRQIIINSDSLFDNVAGIAFSPNSRFLYVTAMTEIYQIDTWDPNPQASIEIVGQYDGYLYKDIFPANFFPIQPGPDCRLYIGSTSTTPYLHVIHHPNEKGAACGFEQRAILTPPLNGSSLPNLPYYRAGTMYDLCDSTIQFVSAIVEAETTTSPIRIYPNPASNQFRLEINSSITHLQDIKIRVIHPTGQLVYSGTLPPFAYIHDIVVDEWSSGLYLVQLVGSDGRVIGVEKLVVE